MPVERLEVRLVTDPDDLVRVGIDVHALRRRQAKRRRAEQVCDKAVPLTVPCVEVRARAGWQNQLGECDNLVSFHLHVEVEKREIKPSRVE